MDFIGEFYLDDLSICEKLIEFFETNPNEQHNGLVGTGIVDITVKNSLDISIHPNQLYLDKNKVLVEYLILLRKCVEKYIKKYPDCNEYSSWKITEGINVRRYEPGQSFSAWHTERCSTSENVRDRHLAFMTYLNSVQSGGGTEFKYQKRKINARRGKTIIWPTDWTHTHRGIVSNKETKYIITGWFNYFN